LNVGDVTAHTDSGVIAAFTASEPLYLYTSLQNTSSANTSYASYAVNDGGHTSYGELGINNSNYSYSAAGYPNNTFSAPLATFVESYGGPLAIGTWDSQKISFIVNGAVNTADAMTISAAGNVSTANDITVNGLTVGKGDGNVSTNTAFGVDAIGSPFIQSTNIKNVGIGYNALNTIGTSIGTLTINNGGSGYDDGNYDITLSYLSGTPIIAGGTYPTIGVTVSGGAVVSIDYYTNRGVGWTALNTVFQYTGSAMGAGSGFASQIASLLTATNNIAIGYNAGSAITGFQNSIIIGAEVLTANSNQTIIGNNNTQFTTIRGQLSADSYGDITTDNLTVNNQVNISGQLTAQGALSLLGSATDDSYYSTTQTTGQISIGGSTTSATGTVSVGRSLGTQTVNIAAGANASGTKTVNIGTAGTSTTNIALGSANGTSTTTINGAVTLSAVSQTINIGAAQTTGVLNLGTNASRTGALNIGTGATSGTKPINIGTSGTGTTNIAIGSTTGTSTTTVNGYFKPPALASAPTYVKGAVYFDTTLNKLRVGGATTWETITSI
jgi:hypothetical protein